ncbi:DNA-binding MarR family transcriptional regulator [Nocardia tenerifensis]|uniref:DNA-binding MarR family transcriptional regulator n=1 Tax=Nocardia tenerifensis TaxID=228006 RepID=A0A318KAM6_9NOCA|nr:MarR family transcriptional regulator [Nocardia tenerifensis]PXX68546.1 DNA-binding MarR family transcriptional regulator [Nocardia tenerifensis]
MSAQRRGLDADELARVMGEFTRGSIRLPNAEKHTFTTLSVLHTLANRGPMRVTALKVTEQITQPAITQLVDRLERDGLVERRPDPADGRAVLVHITDAGAEVVWSRHRERVRRLTELAEALTPAQRQAISAALPALRRMAALMDPDAADSPVSEGHS